jgi:hypothetical protein
MYFSWEFGFSTGQPFSLKGCWIKSEFETEQIVTEYLWMWLAAFLMAILYTIMFIVMRGWFTIGRLRHGTGQPAEMEAEEDTESKAIAILMLL